MDVTTEIHSREWDSVPRPVEAEGPVGQGFVVHIQEIRFVGDSLPPGWRARTSTADQTRRLGIP